MFRSVAPDVATTLLPGLTVLPVLGSSVPKDRPPQTAEHDSEQLAVPTNKTAVVDIFNQSSCCGPDSCVNDIPHEENVEERRAFFCSLHACCTGSPGQFSIEGHGLGALRRRTYR